MFLTLETKSRNGGNNHLLKMFESNVGRRTQNNGLSRICRQKSELNNNMRSVLRADMTILNYMTLQ
jgi:hypothetical protein